MGDFIFQTIIYTCIGTRADNIVIFFHESRQNFNALPFRLAGAKNDFRKTAALGPIQVKGSKAEV